MNLGKKLNAIRINSDLDIPEFLHGSIAVIQGRIYFTWIEQDESCPAGNVICFEKNDDVRAGYNCRCLAENEFIEKDGVFYEPPKSII